VFSSEGSKSIHAGSRLPLWGIGMDNLNATLNGAMHNYPAQLKEEKRSSQ